MTKVSGTSIDSQPDVTFVADDGKVYHGEEALRRGSGWVQLQEEQNRQAVSQLRPDELARFERWLRTGTNSTSGVRGGRAPRQAVNVRRRGSRRGQRASSSSSDDPDPPPAWRSRRDPWALTWAERQPILWRFRAARCRLLEIREAIRLGVDR